MPVRPTLLHRMALVSFLLFRKNLGKLREFFGQMVYRPPWQKIAHTPMKMNTLAINSKQETICIISTYPSPNPSVPQNIA